MNQNYYNICRRAFFSFVMHYIFILQFQTPQKKSNAKLLILDFQFHEISENTKIEYYVVW